LAYGNPHYRTIKTILEKALDPQRPELTPRSVAAVGAFLRGPDALFTVSDSHEEVSV